MQRSIIIGWHVLFAIFGVGFGWTLFYLPQSISATIAFAIVLAAMAVRATFDIHPRLRAWNLRQ